MIVFWILYVICIPLGFKFMLKLEHETNDGRVTVGGLLLGLLCSLTPFLNMIFAGISIWVYVEDKRVFEQEVKFLSRKEK